MRRKKKASQAGTQLELFKRKKRRRWNEFFKLVVKLFNCNEPIPKADAREEEPPMWV